MIKTLMMFKSSFIVLLVILIDQISKKYLLDEIGLGNSRELLPGFVKLNITENTGGAFSLLNNYPWFFLIIGFSSVVIFLYICFCPTVKLNSLMKAGTAFVLGGTVGNLIDRVSRGSVVDFFDLEFINFAIFNFADVAINIGVFIICVGILNEKI